MILGGMKMTIEEIYEAVKKETNIKYYKIVKEASDDISIFDSKFGGYPYWDFSKEYPLDNKNEKMCLLAQINFDKEKLNDERLPQKGMLQFFISVTDDVYGMDFDNQTKQDNWKVVYHENINNDITEQDIRSRGIKSFKEVLPEYYVPFNNCYKISFIEDEQVISYNDISFNSTVANILNKEFNIAIDKSDVMDYLEEIDKDFYNKFDAWGNRLLGYPAFTQYDPRHAQYTRYDTLLLQIDSGDEIMWGDAGVANFFINKKDLLNKDFNNILYNWDCC